MPIYTVPSGLFLLIFLASTVLAETREVEEHVINKLTRYAYFSSAA